MHIAIKTDAEEAAEACFMLDRGAGQMQKT